MFGRIQRRLFPFRLDLVYDGIDIHVHAVAFISVECGNRQSMRRLNRQRRSESLRNSAGAGFPGLKLLLMELALRFQRLLP